MSVEELLWCETFSTFISFVTVCCVDDILWIGVVMSVKEFVYVM